MIVPLEIPVDPTLSPRCQIEAAIATLRPYYCETHSKVLLKQDIEETIRDAFEPEILRYSFQDRCGNPDTDTQEAPPKHTYAIYLYYQRCPGCPWNQRQRPDRGEWGSRCSAYVPAIGVPDLDEHGVPIPVIGHHNSVIDPNCTADDQLQHFLSSMPEDVCNYLRQWSYPLKLQRAELKRNFTQYQINVRLQDCLRCLLEERGVPTDMSGCSFANFDLQEPGLRPHLETCRRYAKAPKGFLPMIGNVGNGKTHLAIGILNELLSKGSGRLFYISYSDLLGQYRLTYRPPADRRQARPKDILGQCQRIPFLVLDGFEQIRRGSDEECLVFQLVDYRVSHFLPTVMIGNVPRADLEALLGSPTLDRIRMAQFALLEFGFPSRRRDFNEAYLASCP